MLGIRAVDPDPPKQVGLVRAGIHVAGAVKYLADLNAATEQIVARGPDVGHNQVRPWAEPGCAPVDIPAEDNRAPGARRRELNDPEVAAVIVVGVEPPPEAGVKFFRPVDIGDRDDDYLKLCIESGDAGISSLGSAASLLSDSRDGGRLNSAEGSSSVMWVELHSQAFLPACFLAGGSSGVMPACSDAVYGAP